MSGGQPSEIQPRFLMIVLACIDLEETRLLFVQGAPLILFHQHG